MRSDHIAAYVFQADVYCPDCIGDVVAERYALIWLEGSPTAEEQLSHWADSLGYDYANESSYDSWEFPKVVFADEESDGDYCGACHAAL